MPYCRCVSSRQSSVVGLGLAELSKDLVRRLAWAQGARRDGGTFALVRCYSWAPCHAFVQHADFISQPLMSPPSFPPLLPRRPPVPLPPARPSTC